MGLTENDFMELAIAEPMEYTLWREKNVRAFTQTIQPESDDKLCIYVQFKNVYGEEKIYPYCDKAKLLAKLLGQRTFTEFNIAIIKQLGYEVATQPQVRTL